MKKKIYAIATRTRKGTLRRVPDTRFDTEESARRYGEKYHKGKSGERFYEVVEHPDSKKLEEDWQSVNRHDKTDGLSQKAVNAYRRENPGSKLKTAVTEKNPKGKRAARRKSFCSRMSGMKARLTSAKTARDPDSRINKALRRWNCHEETIDETSITKASNYIIDAGNDMMKQYDSRKGMDKTSKEYKRTEKKLDNRTDGIRRATNTINRKLSYGQWHEEKDPCWKGYEMIGMKKKNGRTVPNCVKNEEIANEACWDGYEMVGMKKKGKRTVPNCVKKEEAGGMSVGAGLITGIGGSSNGPGTGDSKMSAFKREPGVSKSNQRKHTILRREDFAGAAVFEVTADVFHRAKFEKRKGKHWRTYLEEDEFLPEIREYAKRKPHKPIILQNERTGEMCYAKYGKKQ